MEKGCRNQHPFLFPTTLDGRVPPPVHIKILAELIGPLAHRIRATYAPIVHEIGTNATAVVFFSSSPATRNRF